MHAWLTLRRWTVCAAVLLAAQLAAYETDPYTARDRDIADSLAPLDAKVNAALDDIAAHWQRGADEWLFVTAIYRRLGGRHWVDRLERWANDSAEVAKLPNSREQSIISEFPAHAARVAWVFGFAHTIRVGDVHFGTDKIGHFFSQGRKFYRRFLRLRDEAAAARWSVVTEVGLFGRFTTGVRSNADLVANYEGHRFYFSLFHDGVVGDKPAMFRWQDGRPVKQRRFTWLDHVNPFWDEALNPNIYSQSLLPAVERRLLLLCGDFQRRPERYRIADEEALIARYQHVGVRYVRALSPAVFLGEHCAATVPPAGATGNATRR